ncbi:MAG: hypothetical protein CVU89_16785 [Firmicutes bacterium HGW-Firmicutes-14]|jgi:gas vesicle protein|nr:MAG: hypothetical protein CVU89_16785 [Firmicutes bacterium HGW-Firmicutes-14]
MRKGFFNGLLTGGMIGAMVTMFVAPQFKKERKNLMKDSKRVQSRARRAVRGVKNMTEDWMK